LKAIAVSWIAELRKAAAIRNFTFRSGLSACTRIDLMPACHPRSQRHQLLKSHCSHLLTLSHASGPTHLSRHRHPLALHFRTEPSRKGCRVGHQQCRQPRPRPACSLCKTRAAAFCRHLPAAGNGLGQQHSIFTSGLCASARRRQNGYCAMHPLALPSSDVPHMPGNLCLGRNRPRLEQSHRTGRSVAGQRRRGRPTAVQNLRHRAHKCSARVRIPGTPPAAEIPMHRTSLSHAGWRQPICLAELLCMPALHAGVTMKGTSSRGWAPGPDLAGSRRCVCTAPAQSCRRMALPTPGERPKRG